jgi:hypothetical protein
MARIGPGHIIGISGPGGWALIALVLAVPLGFAGLGGWLLADTLRFAGVALPAEGVVIAIETERGEDGTLYRPTFRFSDADGHVHMAATRDSATAYDYAIGARVPVLYDPQDPADVRIEGFSGMYLLPVGFLVLGLLVFTAFAVGLGRLIFAGPRPGPQGEA